MTALLLSASAAAGLVFLQAPGRTARGFEQDSDGLNRFVQRGDSPAAQTFRQGRDLIEKEDWAGAAARFEGYLSQHPKSQDADAALYWLAYALKKQRKFQAAEKALERLVGEFPRSTWADDARAMQVEIAPQTGKRVDPEGLDDELKLVALQSLFQSDPARAAGVAAELLKPGSRASRELKETAVSLLGQHGGPAAVVMLLDIARTQPDPDLRAIAVHRLGQTNDERVFDELVKIYESERDREVKGQVLHAFSQMNSPRAYAKLSEVARSGGDDAELRTQAIHWLGQRGGEALIDELLSIFRAERNEEVRHAVLHALSQMGGARARSALLGIARGGDDAEARGQAIHWLGQLDDAASLEELVRLYDAERDEDVKHSLLHAFSLSKQERALFKLMDVARGDASAEMRKQAIHWLGQSRDPRALKFLQDLLR
ncbi:MAG TPA: HEAT repeat domain-containing protein [Pyrinomonadaceae bacterium]|nr:HEAT repeat domain-containing protein [Pyrinomonadaceae bacterium]